MLKEFLFALACLLLFAACEPNAKPLDGLMRSKVDALNKAAFKERYNNAALSELYAKRALAFIDDSLEQYNDGRLRAWNNLATSFCNRAMHDSAMAYIDSVKQFSKKCTNKEVEQTLALIVEARLKQRNCDMAGCYQILYDIEESGFLEKNRNIGMLYDLAISEFYITTTTLNYHYRNKSQYEQTELMTKMEQLRGSLRCDYTEDMSFNYALAYGYYSLCVDSLHQNDYLKKALEFCLDNLRLLSDSTRFSTYHLADTYQLIGFMLWGRYIMEETWNSNLATLNDICLFVDEAFGFNPDDTLFTTNYSRYSSLSYSFLREAAALFFLHDDPYQRLGAVVATGRFCLAHGDTITAQDYFTEALVDTSMLGVAPKFEARLYEGLLVSGCASSLDEVAQWTSHEIDLLNYIKQNEKADFLLQTELAKVRHNNTTIMFFTFVLFVLFLGLIATLILLRRRTIALQHETEQLQQAKQQDVERIANVETCLSVLRHDINPFISYLQNDNLPDELKREVTGQLIRTFENIKNWTNLSIPSGLQFRCSTVLLQDLFDNVEASVNNFRRQSLAISFVPTQLEARGDRQLIEIMLRNLVNNAIQHTTDGLVKVEANSYADDNRFVEVSVSDTGCGMTPEEIENLFRADKKVGNPKSDTPYGSGFGLILCRYIIKKHDDNTLRGCRIWAESTPNQGSTFHFIIQKHEQ